MFKRPWDTFYTERLRTILESVDEVIDIGGGLRFDAARSNRSKAGNAWIAELIERRGISYKVLDYVPTYHPDIVGDVQDLPFADNSQQALICNALLEHVENPIKAAGELYRVLRPGGFCFVYVPFLYYYHAEKGYYKDYWRFTPDSLEFMFKDFSVRELQSVRGALETLVRLTPLGRYAFFANLAFLLDRLTGKLASSQVSGYHVFLVK